MTLDQFKAWLAENAAEADKRSKRLPLTAVEGQMAGMWKLLTPAALNMWTPSGVLEHIAACLAFPDKDDPEEPEDDAA